MIPSKLPRPQSEEEQVAGEGSAREQLSNRMARIFEMQRRANEVSLRGGGREGGGRSGSIHCDAVMMQVKNDVSKLLAGVYPGGLVTTPLTSFSSPQFTKVRKECWNRI